MCGNLVKSHLEFITPDGFQADWRSGSAAGQYVIRQDNLMQSGLIAADLPDEEAIGDLIRCVYQRGGELLYVNEGIHGKGFKIYGVCGKALERNKTRCDNKYRGQPCPGTRVFQDVALGHKIKTDTLHLRFEALPDVPVPDATQTDFWLSLLYSLIHGACRALQIERRDIDGVLFPRQDREGWVQTIVLYDDVPGGAGHVRRIKEELPRVLEEALRVVNCINCGPEVSCYHCLRDYNNQIHHSRLKRGRVVRFLELLKTNLDSGGLYDDVAGVNRVLAVDLPRWLFQQVSRTRQEIWIAAEQLTANIPQGENQTWLDMLQEALQRKVKVRLYLSRLPNQQIDHWELLNVSEQLKLLIGRGLEVRRTDEQPEWQIVIDAGDEQHERAIRSEVPLILGANSGIDGLLTTSNHQGVFGVRDMLSRLRSTPVKAEQLAAPRGIQTIDVVPRLGQTCHERDFFADVFARPVIELFVNDRYLIDEERIVNRLGAYIDLANAGGILRKVEVRTNRAGQGAIGGNREDQDRAFTKLEQKFPRVLIKRTFAGAEHDRFVTLTRADGTRARILIGKGLDFIKPTGEVEKTHIVIEDPSRT
jgi:hypothetical protein